MQSAVSFSNHAAPSKHHLKRSLGLIVKYRFQDNSLPATHVRRFQIAMKMYLFFSFSEFQTGPFTQTPHDITSKPHRFINCQTTQRIMLETAQVSTTVLKFNPPAGPPPSSAGGGGGVNGAGTLTQTLVPVPPPPTPRLGSN